MGALRTRHQGFTVLKGRQRLAGRLPGNADRFPSDESKPASAQLTTRPIAPEQREAKGEVAAKRAGEERKEDQQRGAKTRR